MYSLNRGKSFGSPRKDGVFSLAGRGEAGQLILPPSNKHSNLEIEFRHLAKLVREAREKLSCEMESYKCRNLKRNEIGAKRGI